MSNLELEDLQVDPDANTDLFDARAWHSMLESDDAAEGELVWDEDEVDSGEVALWQDLLNSELSHGFTQQAFDLINKILDSREHINLRRSLQTSLSRPNESLPAGFIRDCPLPIEFVFTDERGAVVSSFELPVSEHRNTESVQAHLNKIQRARHLDLNYQESLALYVLYGKPLAEIRDYFPQIFGTREPIIPLLTWFANVLNLEDYKHSRLRCEVELNENRRVKKLNICTVS